MLRWAVAILFVLAAAPAWAEERLAAPCRSILETACGPPQRVTAKGNLRIEVVSAKRSVTFPLGAAADDIREEYATSCSGGKCVCNELVQYFDFKGPVPGFRQVNEVERSTARRTKCSIENSTVTREASHFAVSKVFVSTAVFELEYCRTCGGSCHGRTTLATHDAKTGKSLTVGDAITSEQLKRWKARLVQSTRTPAPSPEFVNRIAKTVGALSRPGFRLGGIYVENGVAYVNLDTFLLSCADGSFFPLAIPAEFVTPSFATRLRAAR